MKVTNSSRGVVKERVSYLILVAIRDPTNQATPCAGLRDTKPDITLLEKTIIKLGNLGLQDGASSLY